MQLEARKPVWRSISAFYLDTELDAGEIAGIVATFEQSGCSLPELKKIDLYEVFPVLQGNLTAPAGAWNGFDDDWLFQLCEENYQRRLQWQHRLKCRFWNAFSYWLRRDYWRAVEKKWSASDQQTAQNLP
ncbi:MAG: hypothetical protein SFV22_01380 [Saprospiraceae bacterium]|nr:hypothetical protein [Saprospiraceae bacterium]